MKSFLRYPGGKSKHTKKVLQYLHGVTDYCEVFLGGGSVFLGSSFNRSWLNDKDAGLVDLWLQVQKNPVPIIDLLVEHSEILDHKKDSEKIRRAIKLWRDIQNDTQNKIVSAGYRFLFLNKTCFNGVQTGGPTGGLSQTGEYQLNSRWALDTTIDRLRQSHHKLQGCRITNWDWTQVVEEHSPGRAYFFDPPYLHKGKQCYELDFTLDQHKKFAESVSKMDARYVVTLDDCPELRSIWQSVVPSECLIQEKWLYSMSDHRQKNRVGHELFIVDPASLRIANLTPLRSKVKNRTMKEIEK